MRFSTGAVVLGIVCLTVMPATDRPVTGLDRNIEHFLCFALVGFAAALSFAVVSRSLWPLAILFALGIELVQIPLPTRHARISDFLIDAVAGCIGLGIGKLVNLGLPKRITG